MGFSAAAVVLNLYVTSLAPVQALGHFSLYDYREPRAVPEELKGAFSVVVADPPYLVNSCPICIGELAACCRRAEGGFQCHYSRPILSAEQLSPSAFCTGFSLFCCIECIWPTAALECSISLQRDGRGAGKELMINVKGFSVSCIEHKASFAWLRAYPGRAERGVFAEDTGDCESAGQAFRRGSQAIPADRRNNAEAGREAAGSQVTSCYC